MHLYQLSVAHLDILVPLDRLLDGLSNLLGLLLLLFLLLRLVLGHAEV